jgi:hypothetical protein
MAVALCAGVVGLAATAASAGGVISLPKTGQTACYAPLGGVIACANTGQDGDLRAGVDWPSPRLVFSGSCFTDQLTGLEWFMPTSPSLPSAPWADGIAYANALSACGHDDWREANVNEITSLSNSGVQCTSTWLQSQGVVSPSINGFSSTTYASSTSYAWQTEFCDVPRSPYSKTDPQLLKVAPVRGGQANAVNAAFPANIPKTGQTTSYAAGDDGDLEWGVAWPAPRFTNNGDGTITDNLTGLDWTQDASTPGPAGCSPGARKLWQASLDHIQCLNANNYLGHADWRMPNKFELRSLVDYRNFNPALPAGHPFTSVNPAAYWTSTTIVSSTSRGAWSVNFFDGSQPDTGVFKDIQTLWLWPTRTTSTGGGTSQLGPFPVADIFLTPPCWSGGGCTPANFPQNWGTVRTFSYAIPPGQSVLDARIKGTWGGAFFNSTAPVRVYLEGILVAECLASQPCWDEAAKVDWNGGAGFLLSDLGVDFGDPAVRALFEDGSAGLSVVQTDVISTNISNLSLTLTVPEPAGIVPLLAGLAFLWARAHARARARNAWS